MFWPSQPSTGIKFKAKELRKMDTENKKACIHHLPELIREQLFISNSFIK